MAEITINGVKYTNVPNKKAGTKFAASLTQSNIGASQAVQDYVNSAYFYPLVNAIDINWNGVEVDENSYINTTSDLISYIASKESNIDLSSYATMAYVDQKITDLIGGAPETLDTLKELADALGEEASLAYVTQALDGKADKSSLTNYATNSYVTTELDKKANKSDIVQADMCETDSTSKSYVLNNPYQYHHYSQFGTNYYCYNLIIPHNTNFDNTDILNSTIRSCVIIGNNHNIYNTVQGGLIQGYKNKIQNDFEVAFGQYNSSTRSSDNSTKTVFSIGNGTLATRHNALEVKGDGQIYIADTKNGTPYSLQSSLNSKANANDVYTKTEVDNMIPESADLRNYVSYTQANSYYMTVKGSKQLIYGPKTFVGNKLINFRQKTSDDKLGFTLYNSDEKDVGGLEYRPDTINGKPLMSLQHYVSTANMSIIPQSYLGFRQTQGQHKYHLLAPIPYDVAHNEYISSSNYKNFFIPLVFKNGSNKVYTDCTGLVDMASLMPDLNDYATNSYVTTELDKKADKTQLPDMTNYVDINSYNALVARVEELAGWIVSYHTPTPEPEPTGIFAFQWGDMNMNIGDVLVPPITNTYEYSNITYLSSDNNIFTVDGNGECSALNSGNATLTASLLDNSNNVVTTASLAVIVGGGSSKLTPAPQWTENGMNYYNSISVSPSQGLTTLTFSGFPASGWTFTDPMISGITVDTSTGSITVDPANASADTYYVSVSYPGDATYNSYSGTFTITVESGKQSSIGNWYDANNIMTSNKAVIAGDITTYTFTFQSTPASGWSFSDPMMTGITVNQSNGTITIDPHGMPDSAYPINITASYMEDSSYWASMTSFSIKVLPEGANLDFYYEQSNISLSNTMSSQSPMLHNSLASYDHIGYSSSDSNVATVNNYGTIEYVGPGTCTVQATAYDSSNNVLVTTSITVYCTQSKQMTSFQWYDSNNMTVYKYVVNLGGSGTEVFHYDATPADGWTVSGDNGTSIVLDTTLKTLTIDKSSLSTRGNNAIVAQRAEDSSYYSGMNVFNVTVIPAGESTSFYFQTQGISMSPSFTSMSLMLNNNTDIDTMQYPINYSSSDTSVATVDNYGNVQYVGAGNAIITATLSDSNNSYIATATVECTSN